MFLLILISFNLDCVLNKNSATKIIFVLNNNNFGSEVLIKTINYLNYNQDKLLHTVHGVTREYSAFHKL